METEYAPIKKNERQIIVDVLRGFAILGILMVNIHLMYKPMLSAIMKPDIEISALNTGLEFVIRFLFEGKFYIIFSFLFGYGFWLFLNKSVENGKSILPFFRRRMFFLLLFGIAHILLLWAGDILVFYALFGFVLLLFRKSPNKKAIRWAIGLMMVPTILTAISVFFMWVGNQVPEASEVMAERVEQNMADLKSLYERAVVIYSNGSFSDIISIRIVEYKMILPTIFFFYPVVLAVFLMGMLFARKNIFKDYKANKMFFIKSFWWGLGIGIPSNILFVLSFHNINYQYPDLWMLLNTSMMLVGGVSLGLFYVSAITLLFIKGKASALKRVFAPVGRMALTNYLSQSIICAFLFHSYGFGLYGKLEVWQGILVAIAIFVGQVYFSRWWLKSYLFGPFEWLWRSLTYLKWQQINIDRDWGVRRTKK